MTRESGNIVYLEYCFAWREIKERPKKCYILRRTEGSNLGLENNCPI